jgi:hypothetical protein
MERCAMSRNALAKPLAGWIDATFNAPGPEPKDHCFQIRPRFRIPGAGMVDLLTVRHTRCGSEAKSDHFKIGLWSIEAGPIQESDVDGMLRRIHAFQAWYTELLEQAETRGFGPAHRVSVCGNLVGGSIRRSPLVDLLSNWGGSLFFWTWTPSGTRIDVAPSYGKAPSLNSPRAQLKGLLDHLPWEDTGEREESESRAEDVPTDQRG